jgi:hypothetical protein
MRDRLIVFEPLIGFGDGFALGTAQGVSILLGRDHGFEQMNHCGKLVGAELVEQVTGVLYVSGHFVLQASRSGAERRQRLKNSKA